jgi:hypothetical protein
VKTIKWTVTTLVPDTEWDKGFMPFLHALSNALNKRGVFYIYYDEDSDGPDHVCGSCKVPLVPGDAVCYFSDEFVIDKWLCFECGINFARRINPDLPAVPESWIVEC